MTVLPIEAIMCGHSCCQMFTAMMWQNLYGFMCNSKCYSYDIHKEHHGQCYLCMASLQTGDMRFRATVL